MGKARYIYIPDALEEKLKSEANASKLIQGLLFEHYKFSKVESIKDIETQELEIQKKRDDLNKSLEEEEKVLVTKKEIIVRDIQHEEEKIEVSKEKLDEKKTSIKEYFKFYLGREMEEKELTEYLHKLELSAGSGYNLGTYIEELSYNEARTNG